MLDCKHLNSRTCLVNLDTYSLFTQCLWDRHDLCWFGKVTVARCCRLFATKVFYCGAIIIPKYIEKAKNILDRFVLLSLCTHEIIVGSASPEVQFLTLTIQT